MDQRYTLRSILSLACTGHPIFVVAGESAYYQPETCLSDFQWFLGLERVTADPLSCPALSLCSRDLSGNISGLACTGHPIFVVAGHTLGILLIQEFFVYKLRLLVLQTLRH